MHPPPQLFGSVPRPGRAGNASKKVLAQQFCAERANSALGEDLQKRKLCRFAPLNRKVPDKLPLGGRYWQGVQNGPAIYIRRIDLGLQPLIGICNFDDEAPSECACFIRAFDRARLDFLKSLGTKNPARMPVPGFVRPSRVRPVAIVRSFSWPVFLVVKIDEIGEHHILGGFRFICH
jgi:hypothetical protein